MKKYLKPGLLGLLIILLVAACSTTAAPTQESGQTSAAQEPAAAGDIQSNSNGNCQFDACIRDSRVVNDGESLMVFFDMVNSDGKVDVNQVTFMSGDQVFNGFLLQTDGTEKVVFQAQLTNENYFCYDGQDIPWHPGETAVVCGFSIPLGQLQTQVNVGDQLRIEAPNFLGYHQDIAVSDGNF